MSHDLGEALRRFVAARAGYRCEYCLLHEDDAYSTHQIDHIVSRKHGGSSHPDNLAYACIRCNLWKGSDIGSIDPATGEIVSLFHPRREVWHEHFALRGARIVPLTSNARATVVLLKLNLNKRLSERQLLLAVRRYPR